MTTTTDKDLLSPAISDNALAEARALLGMPIRLEQYNYEASRDVIRHYAWGIGDDNPVYADPEYARGTKWGTIIAPPTFFFALWDAVVAPGLPDVQWYYSGIDAEFYHPIKRNDTVTASAEYVSAEPLSGKTVSNMIVQTGDVRYHDQDGRLVALFRGKSATIKGQFIDHPGAAGAPAASTSGPDQETRPT